MNTRSWLGIAGLFQRCFRSCLVVCLAASVGGSGACQSDFGAAKSPQSEDMVFVPVFGEYTGTYRYGDESASFDLDFFAKNCGLKQEGEGPPLTGVFHTRNRDELQLVGELSGTAVTFHYESSEPSESDDPVAAVDSVELSETDGGVSIETDPHLTTTFSLMLTGSVQDPTMISGTFADSEGRGGTWEVSYQPGSVGDEGDQYYCKLAKEFLE